MDKRTATSSPLETKRIARLRCLTRAAKSCSLPHVEPSHRSRVGTRSAALAAGAAASNDSTHAPPSHACRRQAAVDTRATSDLEGEPRRALHDGFNAQSS